MPEQAALPKLSRHLLYEQVAEVIERFIREFGLWGKYLPSERELARRFEVNRETIRKGLAVLGKRGVIGRRERQGTRVAARIRPRVVVTWFPDRPGSGYVSEILSGLAVAAGTAEWDVNYGDSGRPGDRRAFLESLRGRRMDGLVLISVSDRELVKELLTFWQGPTVVVDHCFPELPVTGVRDDSQGGARQAVEHLLALGHRRIGYVEASEREENTWRYDGYAEALQTAGIQPDDELIVQCPGTIEGGKVAGELLLGKPNPPTAVFTFDDSRAWGVWQAAEARGLKVGKDLALVSFGDRAAWTRMSEVLSSVRFSSEDMGRMAASEMENLMTGKSQPGGLVLVPANLMVRDSSKNALYTGA